MTTVVAPEVIEQTAEHVFLAARLGGYANTEFGALPAEHQEFWRSIVRMVLARVLPGRMVIELPAPTDGDAEWEKPTTDGLYWRCRADVDDNGPIVDVVAPEEMPASEARMFFSAGLAAVARAEDLWTDEDTPADGAR